MRPIFALTVLAAPALAVPEGFEIHEFAGPPQVDYPAGISAAPNGDVYVSSDKNGSLGKDPKMGKIIRARDTDGDGKADDFLDFVPDVDSPRGGHWVGGTFFLVHPPYLSAFRDTDGDGVADEKKQLIKGLGGGIEHPRGADHTTNGVRMGIDGWLYVSVGDFGMADAVAADGTRYTLHGGGVIRVRPDGSEMEPFALMTRNICDTAISPTLDLFSRDNTNDGKGWNTRFHHHTALADHGYPRLYKNFAEDTIAPLHDYGGGSGTGALWLHEPGFPGEFGDMLFSCDWTTGNVYHHPTERNGASFEVKQEVFEVLPRATDIDVDGHSRLYLADWRNGRFTFAGEGNPVGMVLQATVTAPGLEPAKFEEPAKADDARLAELIVSRSGVQRLEAQREILRRGEKFGAAEAIASAAKDPAVPVYARVAAIFTLKQLQGADSHPLLLELVDDPDVREFALRALADRKSQLAGVSAAPFIRVLRDGNPRVVLQALIGLERLGAADASAEILTASTGWRESGTSPRLRHTAAEALASLGKEDVLLAAAAKPATSALALAALRQLHTAPAVDGLIALAEVTGSDDLRFDVLLALARLHFQEKPWDLTSWWGTRPDDRGPYFELQTWDASPRIRAALEKNFPRVPKDRQSAFLSGLALNRIPITELTLPGLDPVLAALGTSKPESGQLEILTAAARDAQRPEDQRVEAYHALARAEPAESLLPRLQVLASWHENDAAPEAAPARIEDFVNGSERGTEIDPLREIAATESDAVSRLAWRSLLTLINSPLAKSQWKEKVEKLVAKNPREVGFFQALADLRLPGFEKQIEAGLSFDNDELIAAAKAAQEAVAAHASTGKRVAELPIEEVAAAAMTPGSDLETGKRLYTSQGCIACHSVDPAAEQKGPYLGSAGAKFTRDYLIESILDPNKVVAQGFQTAAVTMKDGAVHLGFVTGEADGVVELRNIAGQAFQLPRAEIAKEEHLPQSMMPPGLAAGLTVEDFRALIDYLASLTATGG